MKVISTSKIVERVTEYIGGPLYIFQFWFPWMMQELEAGLKKQRFSKYGKYKITFTIEPIK